MAGVYESEGFLLCTSSQSMGLLMQLRKPLDFGGEREAFRISGGTLHT